MNTLSHLGFTHDENIPREFLAEFEETVRTDGLEVQFQPMPLGTAYAGIEWLMPTAIVAYIAKPYFESFLKEMGKDHYNLLKEGFKKLYAKVAGPRAPEVTLIATAGKVAKEQPYSLFFSIVAEAGDGIRFKLLIQRPVSQEEYETLISKFLDFLIEVRGNSLDERTLEAFRNAPISAGTILVRYDPANQNIVPFNPLEGRLPK